MGELPEEQVAAAVSEVRRRLPRSGRRAWAPVFFGIVEGVDLPADLTTDTDDYLAVSGSGSDSL